MVSPAHPLPPWIDNLVIGTGLAGLMLALKIAEKQSVLVITKGLLQDTNSFWAQGGIAGVFDESDSFEAHCHDTIIAGAGLCHADVVEKIVRGGPKAIHELQRFGVEFTRTAGGCDYHLTREGGHSKRRVVHSKDATGQAIMKALIEQVRAHPNITIADFKMVVDLITTDQFAPNFARNQCLGAYVLDPSSGQIVTVRASKTFICTGGHGRLYLYTSNPSGATGDGLAMAWRAGCRVANLEFMQFHPTCLFHPSAKSFLISEAVRGEGGIICNREGHPFVDELHPMGSLAPRDVVARAIDYELKRSGESHALLDATHLGRPFIESHFPNIVRVCDSLGLDMATQPIPIVPAAHYCCGGIAVDSKGATSITGLFALGEVACSGLHGANRLASNSLLEACVMAEEVAQHVVKWPCEASDVSIPDWDVGEAIPSDEKVILSHAWDEIRRVMWNYVGIVRSDARLQRALKRIETIRQEIDDYYWRYQVNQELLEVRNLAAVALLTIRCAMRRKESRGIHYNIDYPEPRDHLAHDTVVL